MTIKNKKMPLDKHLTKPKLLKHMAKNTKLPINTIDVVLTELYNTIKEHIEKNGPGKFILPGIFKLTIKDIAPQKEKLGINPFTKEEMLFKAKPATRKVKIKVLKKLKDLVSE